MFHALMRPHNQEHQALPILGTGASLQPYFGLEKKLHQFFNATSNTFDWNLKSLYYLKKNLWKNCLGETKYLTAKLKKHR